MIGRENLVRDFLVSSFKNKKRAGDSKRFINKKIYRYKV
jgi:hypothetical protein